MTDEIKENRIFILNPGMFVGHAFVVPDMERD